MNPAKLADLRAKEEALRKSLADLGADLAERRVYMESPGASSAFLKLNDKTIEWPVVYTGKPK